MVFLSEDDFWAPLFHLVQHTVEANLTPSSFMSSILHTSSIDACFDALEVRVPA